MGLGRALALVILSLAAVESAPQNHTGHQVTPGHTPPEGHRVVKDESYGYGRQYMYGRRDHGSVHGPGQHDWQPQGMKHGMYGMYDHYMIGRVHPISAEEVPQAAEVKGHMISSAPADVSANQIVLLAVIAAVLLTHWRSEW